MKLLRLLAACLLLLLLIACGKNPPVTPDPDPQRPQAQISAEPVIDSASGHTWNIVWNAVGETVRLDGQPVAPSGSRLVDPAQAVTYSLTAASGEHSASGTVTIAPVSSVSLAGQTGAVSLAQGSDLQLVATVQADGSEVPPSPLVTWTSSDENRVTVSDTGLVTAVAAGGDAVNITATSRQDSGVLTTLAVTVTAPDPGDPDRPRASLTAVPLELGDGEWRLSWSASGDSVTLNGNPVAAEGNMTVIHTDLFTHELIATREGEVADDTLTLRGLTDITITPEPGGALTLSPGGTVQLQAVVHAAGSEEEPSQTVIWESRNLEVATVDDDGLVTVLTVGTAEIWATSAQWSGMVRGVPVTGTVEANIAQFSAQPWLESGGLWQLSWNAAGELIELNDEVVEAQGDRLISPAVLTDYVLTATGDEGDVSSTLTLGPITSVTVAGLSDPISLLPGDSAGPFTALVAADGSDVSPSQQVTWSSSDDRVVSVAQDGSMTARGSAPDTAQVSAASVQDPTQFASFTVQLVSQAITDFRTASAAPLEAGSELVLEWSNAGAESLRLVPIVTDDVSLSAFPVAPDATGMTVPIPENKGWLNYRLEWSNPDGSTGSTLLWPALQPVAGWVCSDPEDLITIPDPTLRGLIATLYGINPDQPISCEDVQRDFPPNVDNGQEVTNRIFFNRCSGGVPDPSVPQIQSLEGIQHLIYLVRLELECHELTDISRLAGLASLRDLNLDVNHISDLRPLSNLTELEALGLYNNRVTSLAGLEDLINLEILYLSENTIRDVRPIAGLTNLRLLWLFLNCETEDGEAYYNCLSDLTPLSGLTELETLVMHHNAIADIGFAAGMTSLQHLEATGNRITSLEPLAGLRNLRTVSVDENFLTGIGPLAANDEFPAGAPYTFQRGTAGVHKDYHLAVGYNCFNANTDPLVQQMAGEGVIFAAPPSGSGEWPVRPCTGATSGRSSASNPTWIRISADEIIHP